MNKTIILSMLVSMLIVASIAAVSAVPPTCNDNQGSIWTTRNDCGTEQQGANQYAIGEKVYINGKNFCSENYDWSITGQPGGASEDPGIVVASGTRAVNSSGNFCFEAYTIQADDGGVYKVDFNGKHNNYRVDVTLPTVPEFGFYVGALTLMGALGVFFLVRRK